MKYTAQCRKKIRLGSDLLEDSSIVLHDGQLKEAGGTRLLQSRCVESVAVIELSGTHERETAFLSRTASGLAVLAQDRQSLTLLAMTVNGQCDSHVGGRNAGLQISSHFAIFQKVHRHTSGAQTWQPAR
jgi:hypothetical protein